jgi:hypothetical protein
MIEIGDYKMVQKDFPEGQPPSRGRRPKTCPWCGGLLLFQPSYPVRRLIPGETRTLEDREVPERLRTIPAWVCRTPHCKFREPA